MRQNFIMKEKTPNHQKKLTKTHYLIIVTVAVVFIALVSIIIYLLVALQSDKDKLVENEPKKSRPTLVTEDNVDELIASIDEPVEDGSYEVVMNTRWTFSSNSSDAYIENSVNNTRTVYFDLFIADTKDLVYSSPYIPVGEKIQIGRAHV